MTHPASFDKFKFIDFKMSRKPKAGNPDSSLVKICQKMSMAFNLPKKSLVVQATLSLENGKVGEYIEVGKNQIIGLKTRLV